MKEKKRKNVPAKKPVSMGKEPSYWMIVAIIALVFVIGLTVKIMFYPSEGVQPKAQSYQSQPPSNESLERQVQLVAAEFKCACGGCGELPLIECTCDMPRGALEEKKFIRKELGEGLTVEQVIPLVDKKYGHKIT
ncbi:MAG: hypothetical protein JJE15_08825 [Desulfobacteraceae bacterium]|nr:hypothetical protein [Desulfobacteraceae bacterium]